jgi:large subunit ribosomal protein L3
MHVLGQKLGMTQIFAPDGSTVGVTLMRIPEQRVTQLKTVKKDGYAAVQVGVDILDEKKAARTLKRPQRGHLKAASTLARRLFEFRLPADPKPEEWKLGQVITWDAFKAGAEVHVRGTSKGKGFAGVVKRHHFAGGPASHGHKDNLRAPGSIGSGHPQHVTPGTRMAGHMGAAKASLRNLEVISVDPAEQVVAVKGSVPGAFLSWIEIFPTGKQVGHPVSLRKPIGESAKAGKKDSKKEAKESKK